MKCSILKKNRKISFFDMFVIGIIVGVLVKLLDIYTSNIGKLFSQTSIWILIGVLIVIYSKSKKDAMIRVFVFCIGMLISYYITAEITNSVYGFSFMIGWFLLSFLSPIFSCLIWDAKERFYIGKLISIGVLLITILFSKFLYNGPRVYDIIIFILLFYLLFFKKIDSDLL